MNAGLERELRHDARLGGGELAEPRLDRIPRVVLERQPAKELGMPGFRIRELEIEARERAILEMGAEKLEALVRAGLDEPENEESIGQPPPVGAEERHELFRVRVSLVSAQGDPSRDDALKDGAEMLKLFHGERAHAAYELFVIRVAGNERHCRRRRFLLAVRVVDENGVDVHLGNLDPLRSGRRNDHDAP